MANLPGRLQPGDILYRAITPEDYTNGEPERSGFEDTGKSKTGIISNTLSFSAQARSALEAIANRAAVRRRCNTGKVAPTAEQMYEAGYRVAAVPATVVLAACSVALPVVSIRETDGRQVEENGHIQLEHGDRLADTWAQHSAILSKEDTIG